NRLRGIPSDLVGVMIVFGVVAFVALMVFVIGRLREKRGAVASSKEGNPQVAKPKSEPSTPAQLPAQQCDYEQVHRIADHQATTIKDFVYVSKVGVWEDKQDDGIPTIKWALFLKNDSILTISLAEIRNNVFFEKIELAEKRFEDHTEVEQLYYGREGSIVFRQRLSPIEAQHIRNTPNGKFRFNRLKIKIANPNSVPVIEPQEITTGDDLETTLNEIAYKETEGMRKLKDEIAAVKREVEEREARVQKPGLLFEIDKENTQVRTSGGGAISRRIQADVKLRCTKIGDAKLAIRQFSAALFSMSEKVEEEIARDEAIVVYAYPDMKPVETRDGWTIDEPLTGYRWYMFFLNVENKVLNQLTPRNSFFRVTMDAVGQESQHIDFFVDSWNDVLSSNSSITLRGAD
ncbi:MAG TPA: hypothetical protein VF435_09525, partial [Pyrinomonadaceae bacterium]